MIAAEISENPIDKRSVYIAAGLISGCGALTFNVMPILVGAMDDAFQLSKTELGDIVASFSIGFTLIAIAALFWVHKVNWRIASIAAVALSVAALAAMTLISTVQALSLLTLLVGVGMGALYALVMAILSGSNQPDRAFGLKLGLETLPGAILLFLLPVTIAPTFGFDGIVLTMAATALLLGTASFFLPTQSANSHHIQSSINQQDLWLTILALGASLLFFTGIAASWAFLELLAKTQSLPTEDVGTILAIAFIICGVGGFVAAAIGDRYGRILPVAGIILSNCVGLWILSIFTSSIEYAIGTSLFLFSVNFALAYTFGLTAEVDSSGVMIVLSAAILSIGSIIGPATAGRLVESMGYDAMLLFSAGCAIASLLLYLFVYRIHCRASPRSLRVEATNNQKC